MSSAAPRPGDHLWCRSCGPPSGLSCVPHAVRYETPSRHITAGISAKRPGRPLHMLGAAPAHLQIQAVRARRAEHARDRASVRPGRRLDRLACRRCRPRPPRRCRRSDRRPAACRRGCMPSVQAAASGLRSRRTSIRRARAAARHACDHDTSRGVRLRARSLRRRRRRSPRASAAWSRARRRT